MTSKVYGNQTRKPVLNSKRSVKRRKKKFHAGGTVQSSPQPNQGEAVGTMLAPDQVAKMSDVGQKNAQKVAPEQVAKMPDIGVAPAVEAVGAISEPVATPTLPKQMQQQMQQGKPTFTGGPSTFPIGLPKGMLDTLRQRQKDQLLAQLDDAMKNNQTSQVNEILGQIRNIGSPVKNPRRNPRIRYNPKKVQQIRKRQNPKKRRRNTRRLRRLLTDYN